MTNNESIKCTVTTCAHHSKTQNRCSLPEIQVGCSCGSVTDCKGTECASFRLEGTH